MVNYPVFLYFKPFIMSLLSTCTTILDLTYQAEKLRDEIFDIYSEIQKRVDSLLQGSTPAVIEEIASLKHKIRKQIKDLQLIENELESGKASLVQELSLVKNHTVQIQIEHDAASGRPDNRIYQFTVLNGLLNWEIRN
jgi:hypothetical protein